jgi:hypothetical protein
MPNACFSYSADVPPGPGTRDAVQPDPPGLRRMPYGSGCFRYEADVPPGLRRMPDSACFSYPADVPRRMPVAPCFSYSVDASLGVRNRDAAQPPLPGLRRMPAACFSY